MTFTSFVKLKFQIFFYIALAKQKLTGAALENPAYSQASRRVAYKIEKDKKLKRRIDKIERKINLSRMKTKLLYSTK